MERAACIEPEASFLPAQCKEREVLIVVPCGLPEETRALVEGRSQAFGLRVLELAVGTGGESKWNRRVAALLRTEHSHRPELQFFVPTGLPHVAALASRRLCHGEQRAELCQPDVWNHDQAPDAAGADRYGRSAKNGSRLEG